MIIRTALKQITFAVACLTIGASAIAGPVMDKILETNTVNVGSRPSSKPYSYVDELGRYKGYSQDIAIEIKNDMNKKYNKDLMISKQEVSGLTRQPLVLNGTIAFEPGSTSFTEERAKFVNFMIIDADPVVPAVLKDNTSIKSLDSFKGKKVSVVAGTTAEKIFRKLNAEKGWGTTLVLAKDYPLAFLQVEQGLTEAVVTNGVLLKGEMATQKVQKFKVLTDVVVGEAELIGVTYGKNDPELTENIKATEARIKSDGTLDRLYTKWFGPLGMKWTAEQRKLVFGK